MMTLHAHTPPNGSALVNLICDIDTNISNV